MSIYLNLLIALVGLLMFGFCGDSKLGEIGRMMFWVGLLVFLNCFCTGGHVVKVLGR